MADFSWVPKELEGRFSYVGGKLVASCEKCGATRATSGRGSVLKEIERGNTDKFKLCGGCGYYKGFKPTQQEIASWPEGHKKCGRCKELLPFEQFHKHRTALFGYNTICKDCRKPIGKEQWANVPYKQKMFDRAKGRSARLGREFTITMDDFEIGEKCPVFGIPYEFSPKSPWVPSIDRIDSNIGYVPGNIQVISWRANWLKNNMTAKEAEALDAHFKAEAATANVEGTPVIVTTEDNDEGIATLTVM